MCWAANRVTTVMEDRAYCLLGVFGINMPLLYGEREKAFTRLQQEIVRTSSDYSLFAWSGSNLAYFYPRFDLFASSPNHFQRCGSVAQLRHRSPHQTFELTNRGMRMSLPVLSDRRDRYLALLGCYDETAPHRIFALPIVILKTGEALFYGRDRITCSLRTYDRRQWKRRMIMFTGRTLADISSSSAGPRKITLRFCDARRKSLYV